MSRSRDGGAPSNSELAERTARIEANVEHVAETVDRIEASVVEEQQEIEEQVEQNADRLATLWPAYRVARWMVPIGVAAAGSVASLAGAGVI